MTNAITCLTPKPLTSRIPYSDADQVKRNLLTSPSEISKAEVSPLSIEDFPWRIDAKLVDEVHSLLSSNKLTLYENWVIFRFGCELGNVEDVDLVFRRKYPDALLVRMKDGEIDQALNIEFEENSSHFRDHKHDPTKCDLIVCASHDWKERFPSEACPLPVYVVSGTTSHGKLFPKEG